jgi:hypothetical protein
MSESRRQIGLFLTAISGFLKGQVISLCRLIVETNWPRTCGRKTACLALHIPRNPGRFLLRIYDHLFHRFHRFHRVQMVVILGNCDFLEILAVRVTSLPVTLIPKP